MRYARIVTYRHGHADGERSERIKRERVSSFVNEMLLSLGSHNAIMPDCIDMADNIGDKEERIGT